MVKASSNHIYFTGSNFMRQRLILSLLSGKSITITDIRPQEAEPGLREYEVNLLRLLDKITNGMWLEVNETGTSFSFTPGSLTGGDFDHECCKLRGLGYYLEVIFSIAPFCKKPLTVTLRGVTNNQVDVSVDAFKQAGVSTLKQFAVVDPGILFEIKKRGAEPDGGGEIRFHCPLLKLKAVQFKEMGKVEKVRGTAFSLKVSPALANRFIESAKGEMIKYLPNVFITCDFLKGQNAGKSQGYGGCLVAETTTGVKLTAEKMTPPPPAQRQVPEDMGKETAWLLLEEIARGGVVDSSFQALACLLIAFGQKNVSQIVTGPLSPYTIQFLRHLKKFLGIIYKLEPFIEDLAEDDNEKLQTGTNKILVTGVGVGYHRFA